MNKFIIPLFSLLASCYPNLKTWTPTHLKFHAGEIVKVTTGAGFYQNCIGTVMEYSEQIFYRDPEIPQPRYRVDVNCDLNSGIEPTRAQLVHSEYWIDESELEPTK